MSFFFWPEDRQKRSRNNGVTWSTDTYDFEQSIQMNLSPIAMAILRIQGMPPRVHLSDFFFLHFCADISAKMAKKKSLERRKTNQHPLLGSFLVLSVNSSDRFFFFDQWPCTDYSSFFSYGYLLFLFIFTLSVIFILCLSIDVVRYLLLQGFFSCVSFLCRSGEERRS